MPWKCSIIYPEIEAVVGDLPRSANRRELALSFARIITRLGDYTRNEAFDLAITDATYSWEEPASKPKPQARIGQSEFSFGDSVVDSMIGPR